MLPSLAPSGTHVFQVLPPLALAQTYCFQRESTGVAARKDLTF